MSDNTCAIDPALAKEVRNSVHQLTSQIGEFFFQEGKPINEIIIVPLTIIARIIRTHDAIELLLKNGHPSEAAVLALTQFELRLDLAYTACNVKHAGAWLGHEDTKWSLSRTADKINMLFKDEAERSKLRNIFQYLSGIKHGNPVYSELGFPGRATGRQIQISTGEIDDDFSKRFTEIVHAYSTYQLAWSSQVLNVHTAKYAIVDKSTRQKVRELAVALHPFEQEFLRFFKGVMDHRGGHFGMKAWKRKKKRQLLK